ncbi:hypothetical protein [Kitasatospora sp. DSM 101779]|uniref:hypothetical protein n=1 Tax=Kitasatospora sp. DSM 101779 TaxID=2853165 RepID=UPI0021D9D1FA|nr:hypothetical protein [Kitasatospora sp. DSM 101779]MCU7823419.1 hypothetical protein [Kitasatospora sp. DSM 101779]
MASSEGRTGGHDKTALDEIELAGELMIAASTSSDEKLATEQIDRVLLDRVPTAAPRQGDAERSPAG